MAKARRKAVPSDVFVKVWTQGCIAGKSSKDIAADLGMTPASATVRADLHLRLAQAG
jgi:hypothetical protein